MKKEKVPIQTECPECKWRYPSYYLNSLMTNDGPTKPICGICALRLSNAHLGINRARFEGEMAEHLRTMAINWRERHPDLGPKEEKNASPATDPS